MSLSAKIILTTLAILMVVIVVGAFKAGKKKAKCKGMSYLLAFALFFTLSSLFWTTDIAYNTETITHLEFGWPIKFMAQDQRYFNPPFPYPMRADFSGVSSGMVLIWGKFLFSVIINFILAAAMWRLVRVVASRRYGKMQKPGVN